MRRLPLSHRLAAPRAGSGKTWVQFYPPPTGGYIAGMPNRRFGRIGATLVGAVPIMIGVAGRNAASLAIAGAILIGAVLIAAALPGPPPPQPKPKPPHPLD